METWGCSRVSTDPTLQLLHTAVAECSLLFQSRGFELSYLAKVSEVKDTVHRQTLLHHLCHNVVEKFPDTTDLYSEIAAITRSAKVRCGPACLLPAGLVLGARS